MRAGRAPARLPSGRREWAQFAAVMLAVVAWNAAFPRAAYLARWPTRLGPRGLAAYVACRTAVNFWLLRWVLPWARARAEEVDALKAELRARLGREPTEVELSEALLEAAGADVGDPRELRLVFGRAVRWWPARGAGGPSPSGP